MAKGRSKSRREFLGQAVVVAPAVAVIAGTVGASAEMPVEGQRRTLPAPNRPFSSAVVHDRTVYVSGSIGVKPGTRKIPAEFEAECRNVFESMKSKVEAAGSSMDRVLKCTCFLTDVGDFKTMNALFGEYFPSQPPARSTVVVKALVVEGARVEIDCIATL
jgi:2-iminobutanoate/2-iminopropanoate deaminase